ncbi:MAG: hypothetical protein E6J03_06085 [Chloroflexi bacterium]|nr:MAG: hypothetical protein E6J03_06085 [Chloroflexota bacterium]
MARLYAQLFTLVFAVVGLGGLALGDAGHTGGGNLGGLTLHLTWARDILDIAVAAALALVGFTFRVPRQPAAILVVLVGALLTVLAVSGFIVGDDSLATKGFAGLHFPAAINVLDLLSGVLGLFSGVVTLADQPDAA